MAQFSVFGGLNHLAHPVYVAKKTKGKVIKFQLEET
jgi:hypothetical protein